MTVREVMGCPPASRWPARGLVMLLGLLAMAPTPGDIGGCGQAPDDLDAQIFYTSVESTDCRACVSCGFSTRTCDLACGTQVSEARNFPEGCAPVVHDGEVCLRRLQHDSCEAYRDYVADDAGGAAVPLVSRPRPGECQFCPPRP
jgi:hypothetical protein